MDKNYNIDDILEEIKRKKASGNVRRTPVEYTPPPPMIDALDFEEEAMKKTSQRPNNVTELYRESPKSPERTFSQRRHDDSPSRFSDENLPRRQPNTTNYSRREETLEPPRRIAETENNDTTIIGFPEPEHVPSHQRETPFRTPSKDDLDWASQSAKERFLEDEHNLQQPPAYKRESAPISPNHFPKERKFESPYQDDSQNQESFTDVPKPTSNLRRFADEENVDDIQAMFKDQEIPELTRRFFSEHKPDNTEDSLEENAGNVSKFGKFSSWVKPEPLNNEPVQNESSNDELFENGKDFMSNPIFEHETSKDEPTSRINTNNDKSFKFKSILEETETLHTHHSPHNPNFSPYPSNTQQAPFVQSEIGVPPVSDFHSIPAQEPLNSDTAQMRGRDNIKQLRKEKVREFGAINIENIDQDDEYSQQEREINDYNSPADTPAVYKEIKNVLITLFARIGVTAAILLLLIYFAFSLTYPLPLPKFMFPESDMRMFIIVNFALTVLTALVCCNTVGGGLLALFTLKANADTPAALATLATIIQGAMLIVTPEIKTGVHIYFAVSVLSLFFNSLGKIMLMLRILRNFKVVSSSQDKYSLLIMKAKDSSREFTRGLNVDLPFVAYAAKSRFLSAFLELSYDDEYPENINKILIPIAFIGSIIVGVITYFMVKDLYIALTAFTAIACISAPLTATISGNKPLSRLSRYLAKNGAMVSGYTAVEHFSSINTVVIRDKNLFATDDIILHGIKVFAQNRIDEAILDAASVICTCNSMLSAIFLQVIGGKDSMLKGVDSLVYEDGLGLSAWVNGKRVLIGTSEFMRHHGVQTPSREYEIKYARDGRELLYLSNSGDLTAMFIIGYSITEDIALELDKLAENKVSIVLYTNNPHITAKKINTIYAYPTENIKILPAKLHEEYEYISDEKDTTKAEVAFMGNVLSMFRVVHGIKSTKNSIALGSTFQLIGTILGYSIVTFFALMGGMSIVNFLNLIIYQMFWVAVIMIVPAIRRL